MRRFWVIVAVLVLAAGGLWLYGKLRPDDPLSRTMQKGLDKALSLRPSMPERGICARYGTPATHPENTLPGFLNAAKVGAHLIKFSVLPTKDGHLVAMRPLEVDYTTDGKGKVADLTLAEIKRLDAGGRVDPSFAGTRVPTLGEVLEAVPVNIWVVVDTAGGPDIGRQIAQIAVERDRVHQVILGCRRVAAEAARQVAPDIKICYLDAQRNSWEYVNGAIAFGADMLQLHGPLGESLTPFIKAAKEAGLKVFFLGANRPEEARQAFDLGMDYVVTFDAATLVSAAAAWGIEPLDPIWCRQQP
ncbi:MAG TPA: hypothetical protein ENN87_07605 [Phycisphaerales bacterium]|nr:hypothetical protein [Phycisphaerales bacterium]